VGLYQINAVVPSGLPLGSSQVIVMINGISSNVTTLYVQ
jgi:uncharacterized protein (TIGR03437 family)